MHFSEQYLRDLGVKTVKIWLPAYSPLSVFLANELGYRGDFLDIHLECIPFDPGAKIEWLRNNFFYTMGDYDVY